MKFDAPAGTSPIDRETVVGKPHARIDGPLNTTGPARYLGAAVARGRINRIDTAAAPLATKGKSTGEPINAVGDFETAFAAAPIKIGSGVALAIANAIYNATGVRVRDYPLTLDKHLAKLPEIA